MIGTTSYGISYQLRDTTYAGATGMLLHINGKFTIGKLGVELKSFKHIRYLHFHTDIHY